MRISFDNQISQPTPSLMLRLAPSRQSIIASLCLLTLLLSACIGSGGTNPTNGPPLANKHSAHGCFDLRGTYVFDEIHRSCDGKTFSVL